LASRALQRRVAASESLCQADRWNSEKLAGD
jgi:hypothetical protein